MVASRTAPRGIVRLRRRGEAKNNHLLFQRTQTGGGGGGGGGGAALFMARAPMCLAAIDALRKRPALRAGLSVSGGRHRTDRLTLFCRELATGLSALSPGCFCEHASVCKRVGRSGGTTDTLQGAASGTGILCMTLL